MSAETLERSVLEGKDRDQLIAIASALGLKALSRAKKGDIIDRILEQTGSPNGGGRNVGGGGDGNGATNGAPPAAAQAAGDTDGPDPDGSEPLADWELELRGQDDDGPDDIETEASAPSRTQPPEAAATGRDLSAPAGPSAEPYGDRGDGDGEGPGGGRRRRRRRRKGGGPEEGPQGVDRGDGREQSREPRPVDDVSAGEPVEVAGYLDLRDEG